MRNTRVQRKTLPSASKDGNEAKEPGRIRVLIVDDIDEVRQGLVTMLNLAAKKISPYIEIVGVAKNGEEASSQSQLHCPDIVLMDLEMPVMDGCTATQLIKSNDPSIGVIILTIHVSPGERRKAAQAGADVLIEKGAQLEELLEAIQIYGRASISNQEKADSLKININTCSEQVEKSN